MAKPDPASLDPAHYPFHCELATRFGDLDFNAHLNNVALAGILEDGRVRFHRASGFQGIQNNMSPMVVSFSIEYLAQAYYPHPLDLHGAIARIGRTSFGVQQLVMQEDRIVCFAQSVMVCTVGGQPAPLPAGFVEGAADWMLRS